MQLRLLHWLQQCLTVSSWVTLTELSVPLLLKKKLFSSSWYLFFATFKQVAHCEKVRWYRVDVLDGEEEYRAAVSWKGRTELGETIQIHLLLFYARAGLPLLVFMKIFLSTSFATRVSWWHSGASYLLIFSDASWKEMPPFFPVISRAAVWIASK